MPSSADAAFRLAFDDAFSRVAASVRALAHVNPRIVIDGRSGSGKTTLAARLRDEWPLPGEPRVVALDEFYPGWDGLAEATRVVADDILSPLAAGLDGAYSRWDWTAGREAERRRVDPDEPLIVEGAGALSARAAESADLSVWVDAPEASRRARALARDGETYTPHWERWAAQERAHIERDRPAESADIVIELP
ncbi:nucleoside/nucleotide kinase family protein [Microbacterium halophytorum]|uniref:hypothetical protein n=1 Tax=Microbacterium halophytorum TaxID=2067568 RepID=UPI000CFDF78B|nr:hypothetical protein [Microbacterium halophytorum]